MLGRLIRVAIAILLVLAVVRAGEAFLAHYRFSDAVDLIAERGVRTDEAAVRAAVADAVSRFGVPVNLDQVAVRIQPEHVYIDIAYTRPIEVLPRYRYPWRFEVHAHGWIVPSGR